MVRDAVREIEKEVRGGDKLEGLLKGAIIEYFITHSSETRKAD